jgi:TonB family protein
LLDAKRNRRAAGIGLRAAMFLAALALIVPLAAVRAQTTAKGSIMGLVYDPSGAAIPRATLSFKNTGSSNEEVGISNAAGQYKLQDLPAGEYLIKVSVPGFATYQRTLSIEAGKPVTWNVNLALGEVKETVEIVGKRQIPAATAEGTPQRIRVGGNVQALKLISKVNPDYPRAAQDEGIEGTVLLRAVVSKDGSLLKVTSISNGVDQRLVNAATAVVPLWRYQPTLLNGEPVEVITTIAMTFRLN